MTDTPDLNDLARRYMDLWQQHLSDLAADGQIAGTLARTIDMMTGSAAAIAAFNRQLAEGAKPHDPSDEPSGTATPAPAHGGANPDGDELAGRVAELEKRLDQLEAASQKTSRKPAKRPAKR